MATRPQRRPRKPAAPAAKGSDVEALRKKLAEALSDDKLDDGIPYEYLKLEKAEQIKALDDVIAARERAHFNARLALIGIEGNDSSRGEEPHYEGDGKPVRVPTKLDKDGKVVEEGSTVYQPCQCYDCVLERARNRLATYEFQLRQFRGLLKDLIA